MSLMNSACFSTLRQHRLISLPLTILLCFLGTNSTSLWGQATDPLTDVGIPPFVTTLPVENGWIGLAAGNLHLEIPLGSFPQRGRPPITLTLVYDSRIWPAYGCCLVGGGSIGMSGWAFRNSAHSYTYPNPDIIIGPTCHLDNQTEWETFKNWVWSDPYGNAHQFNITTTEGFKTRCGTPNSHPNGNAFANDLSGYHMYVTNFTHTVVYGPDGELEPDSGGGSTSKDTNGNYVSTPSCEPLSIGGFAWNVCNVIDTLGRSLVSASLSGNTLTFNVLNSQGGTSTYTATLETINVYTHFSGTDPADQDQSYTMVVIQSLQMPDGTNYQFGYDSGTTPGHYGELTSMTVPTGAQITYTYSNFVDSEFVVGAGLYKHISRGVIQRTTPDGTWTLTPAVLLQCTSSMTSGCKQQMTVTKPAYNGRSDNSVYKFVIFRSQGVIPYEIDYYNGGVSPSNLLATQYQTWDYSRLLASTVSLPTPGGTINRTTQYCDDRSTGAGNILFKWEWNFYTGAVLPDPSITSTTCTRTATTAPYQTTTYNYKSDPSYLAKNIVNLEAAATVTDQSGNTVAQTNNAYDGSPLAPLTGIANHDDTNYGPTNTIRGNLTQTQKLVSGTSNFVTTSTAYDTTGQVTSFTDGNGNVALYGYTDDFFNDSGDASNPAPYTPPAPTNAYLTSTTRGSLTTKFGYYWGTGQRTLTTDENNQTTYSHYFDPLNRPTSKKMPDGGWTLSVYPHASQTQVDTGQGIASSTPTIACPTSSNACRHDQILTDGLGRTTSIILVSDPDGQTTNSTTYDSNGRVLTVTNPYRSTSDFTYGLTTNAYDGLNRLIQIQDQDGSVRRTYYGSAVPAGGGIPSQLCSAGLGYPVLAVDEAGKKRQRWEDGFGRLIEVDEPDLTGTLAVPTCYSYDLNNNLTSVLQNGSRQRTFLYDFLSRLTTATNPESGTTTYAYDANGNVTSKTSPAPNQISTATVTLSYCYDALDRMTAKAYTFSPNAPPTCSGTPPTFPSPAATYAYDAIHSSGPIQSANDVGRLAMTWSPLNDTGSIYNYDAMGRLANVLDCIDVNCNYNSINSYTYDLAGNMTGDYNKIVAWNGPPLNSVIFNQSFDSAGRATKLTSSWADAQHPGTLITVDPSIGYFPHGALRKASLGNGLTLTNVFNNRLQPCLIDVNQSNATLQTCNDPTPSANSLLFWMAYDAGTADNGNVTHWNASSGPQRFVRTYTYDSLNRLATMADSGAGESCTGLSWSYDAWGNRTAQTVTGGSCYQQPSTTFSAKNQLPPPYQYDAAGNMTNDGTHSYNYDAENRLIQVDGGSTASYGYDPLGRRVLKTTGGTTTSRVYDLSGNVLLDTQGSGYATVYIYFAGRLQAQYRNSTTYFVHADHLGSTHMVTDVNAHGVDSLDYFPFGELNSSDSGVTSHEFTGKERDSESSNDYFGARYYSSTLGRFMSPDWAKTAATVPYADFNNPQSLNLYAYVRNNPLNATDPDGHCWFLFHFSEHVCNFIDYGLWKNDKDVKTMINNQREWLKKNFVSGGGYEPSDIPNLSDKDVYHLYNNILLSVLTGNISTPEDQAATTAFVLNLTYDKLQKIYDKHASDFGLSGPKNTEQLAALKEEIRDEVYAPSTRHIQGEYRGSPATIHLTWLNNAIVTDANGNVIAAFKLGMEQVTYVLTSGRLN